MQSFEQEVVQALAEAQQQLREKVIIITMLSILLLA